MCATLIASAVFTAVFIYIGVRLADKLLRPYGVSQPTVYGCLFTLVLFCAFSAGAVAFCVIEALFSPWRSNGSVLAVVFLSLEGVAAVTAVVCGVIALAVARRQAGIGLRAGGVVAGEQQAGDWALYVVVLAPMVGAVSQITSPLDDQFLPWLFWLVWVVFMLMALAIAWAGYSALTRSHHTKRGDAGTSVGPVGAAYLLSVGVSSGLLLAFGQFVEIPLLVRLLPPAIVIAFALIWMIESVGKKRLQP